MFRYARLGIIFGILLSISSSVFASTSFVVNRIQVNGLQRISNSAVMLAMPLHVGQTYNDSDGNKIIAALFKTGFFSNVQLAREGNTLIINVVELPTIDSITITGNKAIKAKALKPVLKKLNIVVGDTFDPSELHAIVIGLQQQYAEMGQASATVIPTVKQLPRNRVSIHIIIKEGKPTIVKQIHITGNHVFSQHELFKQFKLSTPSIFTWFNHNDRYSEMRLDADLQSLQNFYYNHGYLEFRVLSHMIQPTGNGGVALTIAIYEGPQYHLSGYQLTSANLRPRFLPKIQQDLQEFKKGEVFSKAQVLAVNKEIGNYLADNGYAFPMITPTPTINRISHEVFLNYDIQGGQRVYVRKIHIIGNTRTDGDVIRSQFLQMEGAPYSQLDIDESKRRLRNLPYLKDINVTTQPVPNDNNQVDLDYHVHEESAGRANLSGGYSDMEGFLYGANISEPNFLGTGRYVSLGFQRSDYSANYGFTYSNPFYTTSGISRSFSVNYSHTTPSNTVNLAPFTMDDLGTSVTYGIPITEFTGLTAGVGYDHIAISNVNPASAANPNGAPISITSFLAQNPQPYNQFKLLTGLMHATYDRAIFPTSGNQQSLNFSLGVPVINSSLAFYQAVYDSRYYFPIGWGFILDPHLTLGYGNGYDGTSQFPFFNNFYAGGIQTLPGYQANTLGPKNPFNLQEGLGGNVEVLGGLNFILPDFISNKVRIGAILTAGNIFETNQLPGISYESVSLENLRVTAGIMVSWWSPLGAPLDFSLAWPLNQKPGDQLQVFGFSFGATI